MPSTVLNVASPVVVLNACALSDVCLDLIHPALCPRKQTYLNCPNSLALQLPIGWWEAPTGRGKVGKEAMTVNLPLSQVAIGLQLEAMLLSGSPLHSATFSESWQTLWLPWSSQLQDIVLSFVAFIFLNGSFIYLFSLDSVCVCHHCFLAITLTISVEERQTTNTITNMIYKILDTHKA